MDGDCYADVAVNTTFKLLQLRNQPDIPVAVSSLEAVNPFPAPYRSQGLILDCLPMLNTHPSDVEALRSRQLQQQPGQEFFAQLLLQQTEKVTVIATGECCAAARLLAWSTWSISQSLWLACLAAQFAALLDANTSGGLGITGCQRCTSGSAAATLRAAVLAHSEPTWQFS